MKKVRTGGELFYKVLVLASNKSSLTIIFAGKAITNKHITIKYSRRDDVDERVSNEIRSGLGQAKKQRLFEQTKVGIALVCGEAASGGDKASASCGFGRNSRRLV